MAKQDKTQLKKIKLDKWRLLVFAAGASLVGTLIFISRAAPPPPTVYLQPASQTMAVSTTFTVQVRENSSTTGVNAVQANLSYPATLVDYVSMDATGSAFSVEAQATGGSGTINIARGASGGTSVTGDQLVTTITFRSKTTNGVANVTFTSGTALVSSSTNQDILGGLSATGPGAYTVDANPPTVNVTSPANNATLAFGGTTAINATATDAESSVVSVTFWVDGVQKGTDATSPYSYSWDTTGYSLGAHTIQAKATDTIANLGSSSVINVTLADQTVPTVSITAPTAGSSLRGTNAVNATSADNIGVVGVQFKLDGVNLGVEDTTSPYSISWDTTTATNGTHSLTAFARDAAGNTTTSSAVSVTVDNAAPTVSMTAPANGVTVTGSSVPVSATATDNIAVAGVQFKLDGANLSSEDTSSPFSITWNSTTASDGSHSLSAVARDAAGNTTTSSTITVTVLNNPPPTVNLSNNVNNVFAGNPVVLTWSSTNSTSCTASGAWSGSKATSGNQTVNPTVSGTYTLTCSNTGGSANASVTLTVYKAGDANHDGHVDVIDLSTLLSNFGTSNAACDFNIDAVVNVFDLSIMLSNYGT